MPGKAHSEHGCMRKCINRTITAHMKGGLLRSHRLQGWLHAWVFECTILRMQLILSLLREKVERKPLGVEELAAAAAAAASTAEPPVKARQCVATLLVLCSMCAVELDEFAGPV